MNKNNIDTGGRDKITKEVYKCVVLCHKSVFVTIFVQDCRLTLLYSTVVLQFTV